MLFFADALPKVNAGANQAQKDKRKNQSDLKVGDATQKKSESEPKGTTQNPTAAKEEEKDADDEEDGIDPDLPAFVRNGINKEAYLAARSDQINLMRGSEPGKSFDVTARSRAIQFMEAQRQSSANPQAVTSTWSQIGPAPIPNGQTQTTSTAVSGRTTCIAIDPTNSNNVYVGTAQGGLYRSLDGGTTWLAIFDTAQSLAIGALAFAPGNPTTIYVGTGEANGSADSYAGVGLYRIDSATTSPVLTGPINPVRNYLDASNVAQSVPIFNGRSISSILPHPTVAGSLLVGVAGGVIGIGADAPFGGTVPQLAIRGMYRVKNANGPAASATGERIKVTTTGAGGCFDNPCTGNRNINDMIYDKNDATGNTVVVWMNGVNVAGDGGIFRSTNAWAADPATVTFTQSFTTTATSTSNARGTFAGYLQSGTMVIYAASGEPSTPGTLCNSAANPGAIRRSTDGGATWSAKLTGGGGFCAGQCFYNIGLAVSPGATPALDTVYIAGNVQSANCAKLLGKSVDGGATVFANLDNGLHADTHFVAIDPSNANTLYHGNDGGVFKSTNAAVSWTSLNNTGFHATQFQSISVHPTDRYFTIGGTQDNGTEKMTNTPNPFSWTRSDGGDGGFALIDQNAVDTTNVTMYHTYFNQTNNLLAFARSTNAGTTWPAVLGCGATANGIGCAELVNFYAPMALGPGTPNTVYYGSDRLYRSVNNGTTMTVVSQAPFPASSPVSAIGVSKSDDNYRMVGQNNCALWFTSSAANPLPSLDAVGAGSVIPDKYVTRCVFDPNNKNIAYITLAGYMGSTTAANSHVWRITNLNTTPVLTAINTGLPDVPVNGFVVDPADSTHLYAGTDIGVYASTNSGTNWALFGTGLPIVAVFDMAIAQPNTANEFLRIATHGRGMWEIPIGPTLAKVIDADAKAFDDGRVLISWQTGSEKDNLGFNVYRETNGERVRITPQIVAGSALLTGPGPSLEAGHGYRWSDQPQSGSRQVRYWLEDIDLNGHSNWTGPIEVKSISGKPRLQARNATLLSSLGNYNAQLSNGLGTSAEPRLADLPPYSQAGLQQQTNLAGQPAVKIAVNQEGWYRVGQAELLAAGLSSTADPTKLQLYVDGRELPIKVVTDGNNKITTVEFYGLGLNSAASNTRVYWLIVGTQPGKRISVLPGKNAAGFGSSSFLSRVERKDRTIYFSSLRNGEAENFFGPVVARDPVSQSLFLQHIATTGADAMVEVALQGVTRVAHKVSVTVNGTALGSLSFTHQSRGSGQFTIPASKLKEGENIVQFLAQGSESDVSLIEVIRVTYPHSYTADTNLLQLTGSAGQPLLIDGFTTNAIRLLDVTDDSNPQELTGAIKVTRNGYAIAVTPGGSGQRKLLAFADSKARQPVSVWANQPSSWKQKGIGADLVILTRRDWFSVVEPLKALRQSQGLNVAVVDIEDVFDEFSYGVKTPQAMIDFVIFARTNITRPLRYLMIVGEASYDPNNYLGFGDSDIVPTKLIDTPFMETASDARLADSNQDGIEEVAVGRLPARTISDATKMVSKIVNYDSSRTSNSILLVSDTSDGYSFKSATSQLRNLIPAGLTIDEIDRGEVGTATARTQLIDAINRGEKIVNYSGHGNTELWRDGLLTASDAASFTNRQSLSLFIAMTCLNGFYHDPLTVSLAESLMKASDGGAVAVWASSGMTKPGGQELLNQQMFRAIFDENGGKPMTLGEATMNAKALIGDLDIRNTWVLFGDPSMRLK
jgi:hypothetical protein